MLGSDGGSLESVAHIIQMALTPVFLLSGIAALLNVFSTRLGRVSDRVDQLAAALATVGPAEAAHLSRQLSFQRRRSLWLDAAVVMGALGGVASCGAILALFVGALRDRTVAGVLFALFGFAVLCALGSLFAFVGEMLLAGRGLREEADRRTDAAAAQSTRAPGASGSGAGSG